MFSNILNRKCPFMDKHLCLGYGIEYKNDNNVFCGLYERFTYNIDKIDKLVFVLDNSMFTI